MTIVVNDNGLSKWSINHVPASNTLENIINFNNIIVEIKNSYLSSSPEKLTAQAEILRIKDSRTTATKLTVLNTTTGQEYKYPTVKEVSTHIDDLFQAVNILDDIKQDTNTSPDTNA